MGPSSNKAEHAGVPSLAADHRGAAIAPFALVKLSQMHGMDKKAAYKLAGALTLLALFGSGCSALDATRLNQSQGQIYDVGQPGLQSTGWSDTFYYQSALASQVVEARKSYGYDQVNRELQESMSGLRVQVTGKSGPVEVRLTQGNMSADDISQVRVPYELTISPTGDGDGGFRVEITGQECTTSVTPAVCSQPVTAIVEGFFDINAPTVGLAPFQAVLDERGSLLASGQAADGAGAGVVQAEAVSCDGQTRLQLGMDGTGNYNVLVPLKQGQTCFFVEAKDAVGHTGRSAQQVFSYNLAVSPQLIQTPDGRFQIIGSAGSTLASPVQVTLERCENEICAPLEGQAAVVPDQNGAFSSNTVGARPGLNRFVAWVRDRWGNASQGEVSFEYNFSLSAESALNTDGTINVVASPRNNMLPSFNVQVQRCGNPLSATPAKDLGNGDFSATVAPEVGQNCLEAVAQDVSGNMVVAQTRTDYAFGPGQINQKVEYREKGAGLYLYGDPPETIDPASVAASGVQRDWQNFLLNKEFNCENLGSVSIDGRQYKYALFCDLPANAGDATIRIEMFDKFGHQYSAYYPANTQFIADLRSSPTSSELLGFLIPRVIALALVGAAGGSTGMAGYRRVEKQVKRQRAGEFGKILGNREQTQEFLDRKRRIVRISKKEAAIYLQMNDAWAAARNGNYKKAMKLVNGLDLSANPNLQEIRRYILNGMVDLALRRIGEWSNEGDEDRIEQRDVVGLMSSMDEMIRSPFGSQIDPLKAKALLRGISALQIVKQAYATSPHDFLKQHARIWKEQDPEHQEALRRMVELLLHWKNFSTAREFMRHMQGEDRTRYTLLYEEGLQAVRRQFSQKLNETGDDDIILHGRSRNVYVRTNTRGMRLPGEVEEDLNTLYQIEYGIRAGDHRVAFSNIRTYLLAHPDETANLKPAIEEASKGVAGDLRALVNEKNLRKFADGSLMGFITVVTQSLGEDWLIKTYPQAGVEITKYADELMVVGFAQSNDFNLFERFIGPSHMQSAPQTEVLVRTLCDWKDYETAQLCITHYPTATDRRKMQRVFENEYISKIIEGVVEGARRHGTKAQAYLNGYRLPVRVRDLCFAVGEIEADVRSNTNLGALQKTHAYLGQHPEDLALIASTVDVVLGKAESLIGRLSRAKQRQHVCDIKVLNTVWEVVGMSEEAWWHNFKFADKAKLLNEAREIMIVSLAQQYPYDEFDRRIRARYLQSRQQLDTVVETLCDWKDYATAQSCITRHPNAVERRQMQERFNRERITPLREQFGVAVRSGTPFAAFFSDFRVPPYLEEESRKMEQMVQAEKRGDLAMLMTEIRTFVNGNPESLIMVRPMLEAALAVVAGQWARIITSRDRRGLSNKDFQLLRKAVVEMGREPWWDAFACANKDRVFALAQQMELIAVVESGQFDVILARFQNITDPQVMEETATNIVLWKNLAILDQVSARMEATPATVLARGELAKVLQRAGEAVQAEVTEALMQGNRDQARRITSEYSLPGALKRRLNQAIEVDERMEAPIERVRQVCLTNRGSIKDEYEGNINGILEKSNQFVWRRLYGLTPRQAETYLLACVVGTVAERSLVLGARQFEFRDGSPHVRVSNTADIKALMRRFHPDIARSKYTKDVKDPAILDALVYFYDEFAFKKVRDLVPVDDTKIDYNLIEEMEEFALTQVRMNIIIGLIRLIDPDLSSIKGSSIFDTLCSILEKSML